MKTKAPGAQALLGTKMLTAVDPSADKVLLAGVKATYAGQFWPTVRPGGLTVSVWEAASVTPLQLCAGMPAENDRLHAHAHDESELSDER